MTDELRTVEFPANRLSVPAQGDEMIAVRIADWNRLRARVLRLKPASRWLSNAAWAILGVGVSCVIAWIAWLPTETELPEERQVEFAFVSPLLVILAVASILLGVIFLVVDNRSIKHTATTATDVVADMDDIVSPAVPSIPENPADPEKSRPSGQLKTVANGGQDPVVAPAPEPPATVRLAPWINARDTVSTLPRDNGGLGDALRPGDRINHPDFGSGSIVEVTGIGDKKVAHVQFDSFGRKRLLVKIAPIRPLV